MYTFTHFIFIMTDFATGSLKDIVSTLIRHTSNDLMEDLLFDSVLTTNSVQHYCAEANAWLDRLKMFGIGIQVVESFTYSTIDDINSPLETSYDRWSVYRFFNDNSQCFVKILGVHQSHVGTEYKGNWFFVEPKELTYTSYEPVDFSSRSGRFVGV